MFVFNSSLFTEGQLDFGTKLIPRGHPNQAPQNHGSTVYIDPQYGLKVMNGFETHMDSIHQTSDLNWSDL